MNYSSELSKSPVAETSHPQWLLSMLQQAWPQQWQKITQENNKQAPMSLRVNELRMSRDEYLDILSAANISASCSDIVYFRNNT